MTNPGDFTFGRAELEAAVAKGVLDRGAADSLAEFLIQNRTVAASDPDEERLRLITGFNDIFVTIGIALFLGALYYLLGYGLSGSLGVAALHLGLAPRHRRVGSGRQIAGLLGDLERLTEVALRLVDVADI